MIVALFATSAAESAYAHDVPAAEALYNKGLEAMRAGRYEVACPSLAESYQLDPRPGALFTLAECENKAGKMASALAHYDDYLRLFAAMPSEQRANQKGRDKIAAKQRAEIARDVPELTLVLPSAAPKGTVVKRDGEVLGAPALGLALPIDPGEHVLTTQVPGAPEHRQRVVIEKAEKKRVELEIEAPDVASPATRGRSGPTAVVVENRGGTQRAVGFVVAGAGVAGVAAGAVLGAMVLSKKSAVEDNCTGNVCNPVGKAAAEDGKQLGTASTIAFAAGGGAFVIGSLIVLSAPRGHKYDNAPKVGAYVGPGGASFGARGVW